VRLGGRAKRCTSALGPAWPQLRCLVVFTENFGDDVVGVLVPVGKSAVFFLRWLRGLGAQLVELLDVDGVA